MSARYIDVFPKSVMVRQNGNPDLKESVEASLLVTWVRPNETNTDAVGKVSGLKLVGNRALTDFPTSTPQDYADNSLIKTMARGRSVIHAEVIAALNANILHKLVAALFGAAVGTIGLNPIGGALVGVFVSEIQEAIKKNQLISLGKGSVFFSSADSDNKIDIPLFTTKKLVALKPSRESLDMLGDPDEFTMRDTLLEKGEPNGSVTLSLLDSNS